VEYGQPANVTCSIQKKTDAPYKLGWEAKLSQDYPENKTSATWEVKELTDWEEPDGIRCYFTGKRLEDQCETHLNLTVYKKPDSVNLRSSSEVCVEGKQIELRCEVVNVGPGRILSVRWSRADPKQNNFTIFNESSVPELKNETKNVSITVNVPITPTREDDGAQYQCEALLNLNQPLVFKSEKPITISV
ncbi:vascular cell adhesion protein 1 isoform X2, partial [Silurus asotus]